jgi:AraC family ethanolamine operon transcriptional activator
MTTNQLPSLAVRMVQSEDADEHASHLTNWEQCYDQTTAGVFHGLLEELHLPAMQVFRESTSQGMRQSCCVWPDALWFGLPYSAQNTRINGRLAARHSVLVRPGGCEFELVTPANYTIFGVVVHQSTLHAAAQDMGYQLDWERLGSADLVHSAPESRRRCLHALNTLLQSADPALDAATAQQAVLEALLPVLDNSALDSAVNASFSRRRRIVVKARDFVLSHQDRAVTVPELCQALFVSRRTLQYCFEDVMGINPVQFLRIVRLNGARRQLRGAHALQVCDVAADWGFWHFSQFSIDYRKLFGHSPSDVLRSRSH